MSTTGRIAIKLSGGAAKSPDAYRAMICHSSTESEIDPWIFKRIVVKVSYLDIAGYERKEDIDAVIIGKPSTWFQGRFVVPTYGLGRFYERAVGDFTLDEDPKLLPVLLTQLKANAVVFNYPGIGESTGVLTREGMISAYRGVLCMLEDKDSGIGASEIISMGHSIGGAVQAEAIEQHDLKKDINYVFVKFLTFSTLRKTLSDLICCIAGFVINQVGWNMSSINRQKGFQNPEIVIQTANVDSFEEVFDPNLITHDKVISADASLAKYHLENTPSSKIIMGFPGDHSDRFGTWASQLGSVINQVASKVLR